MAEQDERIAGMETVNDNYDSPWKEAVEHYFPELWYFTFQMLMLRSIGQKSIFSGSGTTAVVQDAELGSALSINCQGDTAQWR